MSDRFNELLPWYVNGTLNAPDRAWMEAWLAEHADARAELAWYRGLQTQLRQDAPAVPRNVGLARTLALVRADRPSWAERLQAFFGGLGLRPGLALAGLALIALQGGVIWQLLHPADDAAPTDVRALGPGVAGAGPLLRLSFVPGTREVDMRLLLVSVQGNVAAGPDAQGAYLVRVPGREAESAAALKAERAVRSVTLATVRP